MPATPTASTQQITTTSPTALRSAGLAFSQALARDIETLTYQLNQLSKQVASVRQDAASLAFGDGWLTWKPTVSAWASMTVSGLTIIDAQYLKAGPMVCFKVYLTMTLGGTASNQIFISLPTPIVGAFSHAPAIVNTGAGTAPAWSYCDPSGNLCKVLLPNEPSYPLGSCALLVTGFYRSE
jgi:hypothetical protein